MAYDSIHIKDVKVLLRFTKRISFWKILNIVLFLFFFFSLSFISKELDNYNYSVVIMLFILMIFLFLPSILPLFLKDQLLPNTNANKPVASPNGNDSIGLTKRFALAINIWIVFPSLIYSLAYSLALTPKENSIDQNGIINLCTYIIAILPTIHVIVLCVVLGILSYLLNIEQEVDFGVNRKNKIHLAVLYLVIFFQMAYLLTISLAAHDILMKNKALYVNAIGSFEISNTSSGKNISIKTYQFPILFKSYSAAVDTITTSTKIEELYQELQKYISADIKNVLTKADKANLDSLIWKINYMSIKNLENKIVEVGKSNTSKRIKLKIIGHSDSVNVERGINYKSNYELTEARAYNTKLFIDDQICSRIKTIKNEHRTPINYEWSLFPLASEGKYIKKVSGSITKRCVEVNMEVIEDPLSETISNTVFIKNRMNLLDYFYFLIYTITTTGYGDIQPISPYSKFITSLANIIEMIFLILFFNILLPREKDPIAGNNKNSN